MEMNRNSIWDNMIFYSEVRTLMVEVGELVMFAKAALVMFIILLGECTSSRWDGNSV